MTTYLAVALIVAAFVGLSVASLLAPVRVRAEEVDR